MAKPPNTMTYTKEITEKLVTFAAAGLQPKEILLQLGSLGATFSEKSIIAKLSSLGLYKKRPYLTKRGEIPVKKDEYIQNLAKLLEVDVETLESLEKVNKNVLALLNKHLTLNCSESIPGSSGKAT